MSGKVTLRLSELLAERARSAYWLAKETGMSNSVVWKLTTGKTAGIQFETIARLCDVLECEPGELFEYQEQKKARK
ncbi:MAG TPA: helix-turn-helix domain-containing protein [Blastocatellia bacterium]|nr:helix-turn-helix domain-containing protein [Blastocatellia bacterium]